MYIFASRKGIIVMVNLIHPCADDIKSIDFQGLTTVIHFNVFKSNFDTKNIQ